MNDFTGKDPHALPPILVLVLSWVVKIIPLCEFGRLKQIFPLVAWVAEWHMHLITMVWENRSGTIVSDAWAEEGVVGSTN